MRQKNCLNIHKIWIFIGFCWIFITDLILHGNRLYFFFRYQTVDFSTINQSDRPMCSTKWYKQNHFEFNAFSVNNFEKVLFLMDDYYIKTIKNRFHKCIFFQFGTTNFIFILYKNVFII